MKKTRVILALLMAMLVVLGGMFMAAADEEGQGSMDVSPGDGDDPSTVEPTEPPIEPTDEPTSEPTDEPTTEPTDEPTSDPTDEPTTEPTDEPTAEPTYEPTPEPPVDYNTGGSDNNNSQGSATRPGINMGGSIRQPSTSSRRPINNSSQSSGSQGGAGSTQAPVEDGPQYVTFARVTQKSNAMSRTLFYGGAACVGTGVLGLVVLVVFVIRGRNVDDREEIIAEIEQAAVRQPVRPRQPQQAPREVYEDDPYAQYDQQDYAYDGGEYEGQGYQQNYDPRYAQGYDSPAPSLHRPEPEELAVPVNGSLYTEEFELPPQQVNYRSSEPIVPSEASMYTEEFEPPRQVPPSRGPIRPTQVSMYTEEFSLPEEMSQLPAAQPPAEHPQAMPVQRPPVQRAPAPRQVQQPRRAPQPQPASKVPPEQMDTTELLREILYGDNDSNNQ